MSSWNSLERLRKTGWVGRSAAFLSAYARRMTGLEQIDAFDETGRLLELAELKKGL